MLIRNLIIIISLSLIYLPVASADQTDISFKEGSVLIRCSTGQKIRTELFEAAFSNWITTLQLHANEGRVVRAHYLGQLKEGIFIVVAGTSKNDAAVNAEIVLADLAEITQQAVAKAGMEPVIINLDEDCQIIEIGPVAVLPKP